MLLALYLTTTIAAADTSGADASRPPTVRVPASTPAVVVHRQPTVPLVSIRLSILSSDPPGHEGAGHMIQHLVHPELRDRVRRVGGDARFERSADAIIYTVTGPSAELDYLARALRATLEPPRPGVAQLLLASQVLAEERLAEWETASLHVRAALRARVFPSERSAAGTPESGRRLSEPGALGRAWSRIYRPERVSVVAAGAVTLRSVQAAFQELPSSPAAAGAAPEADEVVPRALAQAEATRGWLAVAYPADDLAPAAISVVARLTSDALRSSVPEASVDVEHWWTHDGQALVLVVAVPRERLEDARSALGMALRDAAGSVDAGTVAAAAGAVRRDMLFYSRTTDRMVEVIGRFVDREGDPDAADRFHAEVAALRVADVERAFEALLDRTPILAEVPPQSLPGR